MSPVLDRLLILCCIYWLFGKLLDNLDKIGVFSAIEKWWRNS